MPEITIMSRTTSLNNAFVSSIIPKGGKHVAQNPILEGLGFRVNECVYCGSPATDRDHFHALVQKGRPSGYLHHEDNSVPSCGQCNQSKSGQHWEKWMSGMAKKSPAARGISDLARRIARLKKFEQHCCASVPLEVMREAAGASEWDEYWNKLEQIKILMQEAQISAGRIRERLTTRFQEVSGRIRATVSEPSHISPV